MKIYLKFGMQNCLKFSFKRVGRDEWALGGGVDPTSKDGSSPLARLAPLLAGCRLLEPHVRTGQNLKMSPKRRTDLKNWPSKAKNLEELDFDVRKNLAPRKSTKNDENPKKKSDLFFRIFFLRRKKIELCKSSETRVAEVSWRSERSSRGNRTFEVRRRLGGTRGA